MAAFRTAAKSGQSPIEYWIATRNGQAVFSNDCIAPDLAAVWGLGRAAAKKNSPASTFTSSTLTTATLPIG